MSSRSLQSAQPYLDAHEDMVKNAAELVAKKLVFLIFTAFYAKLMIDDSVA